MKKVLLLGVATLAALSMSLVEYHGWLAGPEGKVLDWMLAPSRSSTAHSPIITVEIDDDDYKKFFNSCSPLKPDVLASFIKHAATVRPRVIGVDILTEPGAKAEKYQSLVSELPEQKVVWISGVQESHWGPVSFLSWLLGSDEHLSVTPTGAVGYEPAELKTHREVSWGLPVVPPDEDSVLRHFPRFVEVKWPGSPLVTEPRPSWARIVAQEYCLSGGHCKIGGSADEVYVAYNPPEPQRFRAHDLFRLDNGANVAAGGPLWEAFKHEAKEHIVLIGGIFERSNDFHESARGRMSGLLVNAYAIQGEIDGTTIHEVYRPLGLALDLAIGFLIGWFLMPRRMRPMIKRLPQWMQNPERVKFVAVGLVLVGVVVLCRLLFDLSYVIGAVGLILSILVDLFRDMVAEKWRGHPPEETVVILIEE